ncbi:MAG: hypothetical protein JWM19_5322 [Actinomycetia bacterium]|nr:hypothetical protein [Actinomycetes bacterium]
MLIVAILPAPFGPRTRTLTQQRWRAPRRPPRYARRAAWSARVVDTVSDEPGGSPILRIASAAVMLETY